MFSVKSVLLNPMVKFCDFQDLHVAEVIRASVLNTVFRVLLYFECDKNQKNVKLMEIVRYLCSKYHYRSNYKAYAMYFLAKISSPYEINKLFECSLYQDFLPIIYLLWIIERVD